MAKLSLYEQVKKEREEGNKKSSILQEVEKERAGVNLVELQSALDSWLNGSNGYINSYNDRYKNGNSAYRSDASEWYESISNTVAQSNAEAQKIRSTLDRYGSYYNKDWAENVYSILDSETKKGNDIIEKSKLDRDFWTQFKDEDEYTAWGWSNDYKDYSYDDIKKEITNLEGSDTKKADFLKSYAREKDYNSSAEYDLVITDLNARIKEIDTELDRLNIMNDGSEEILNKIGTLEVEKDRLEEDRNSLNTNKRAKVKEEEIRAFADQYTSAPDFEQKSIYSPTAAKTDEELKAAGYKQAQSGEWYKPQGFFGSQAEWYTGEDDDLYVYLNDPEARAATELNHTITSWNGSPVNFNQYKEQGYDQFKEDEVSTYNYLYAYDKANGTSKADEFIELMKPTLVTRAQQAEAEHLSEVAKEAPVLMSLYSVGTNLQNSMMFLPKIAATAMGDYDDNPMLNEFGNKTTAIRGSVGEELGGIGNLLYQGGMSIADMAVAMAIGGAAAGSAGGATTEAGKKVMGRVTQAIMSSSAGSSAISEAKENGASDAKALMLGLGSAAIEAATEKWSIENLLKNPKNILTYLGTNALTEGTEEGASNLLNIALDQVVSEITKEKSAIMAEYDQLVLSGKSASEASKEVLLGKLKSLGEDVLVGALTGFGMSAGTLGTGVVKVKADEAAYKKEVNQKSGASIVENKTVKELLSIADSLENTKANKSIKALAKDLADIDASALSEEQQKKYSRNVGKLQNLIGQAQNSGIKNATADTIKDIIKEKLTANDVGDVNIKKATDIIYKATYETDKTLTKSEKAIYDAVGGKDIQNYLLKNKTEVAERASEKQQERAGQYLHTAMLSKPSNKIDTSGYSVSDDGKVYITENGEEKEVTITGINSVNKGQVKVSISNGKTVNIRDLDISADDALIFEGIAMMDIDAVSAQAVYNAFKQTKQNGDAIDTQAYIKGAMDAVKYGKIGGKAYLDAGTFTSMLNEADRNTFYAIGENVKKEKARQNAKQVAKAIEQNKGKGTIRGNVTYDRVDPAKLNARQKVTVNALSAAFGAMGVNTEFFASPVNEKGEHIGKNGSYNAKTNTIRLDIYAGVQGNDAILFTAAHELTHFIKEWSEEKFNVFADFLVENYAKRGVDIDVLVQRKIENSKESSTYEKPLTYDEAFEEVVCDSCETFLRDSDLMNKLVDLAKADLTLFEKCKLFIENLLADLQKAYKGLTPDSEEARFVLTMKDCIEDLHAMWEDAALSARDNLQAAGGKKNKYLANRSIKMNDRYVEKHREDLANNYNSKESKIELNALLNRYDKVVEVWRELGGELDSKFLNEWNDKGKDKAFTVFKAQAGYKYNVELSSMCKKGVPLFEAIDQIVKKEVLKKLKTDTIGKAEKEILYDILKQHDFEIPCAICYVEQARQREGVIIDSFLNGKIEKNSKGKTTAFKLGWNEVLNKVSAEMKKMGVDYTFPDVDRSIATEEYMTEDIRMDKDTEEAFREALKKIANEEIKRYNRDEKKSRNLLKATTPAAVKECFKGTLPSNLKIFKVLFNNPKSRFMIGSDLLYSSMTTRNLAMSHNDLYSLFNSQGGVSGYKTKQGTVVYWGDILNKKWSPSTIRGEGGVRNQSNSDFQMYTLLDQVQMYVDFSAKGYYLQAYTKVLSELKLFGLSGGKINASLIPKVVEILDRNGNVDYARTQENAGLDENGELLFDDFEGINHKEAFMLIADPEYSKNICGICIGYSDNHIRKMLDDDRIQLIIGFHDKTDDPNKRYRGARYAKNYNGLNEAQKLTKDGEWKTVHVAFNKYVAKAEKMFKKKGESFYGETEFNGKTYVADDIPRLAADMYLADYDIPGKSKPAYDEFKGHQNYYKLLADFGLYDSEGHYAPHRKVVFNMPESVPFLDADGNKAYMKSKDYMKAELEKELDVRDSISEALADESKNGIIPKFVERVNSLHQKNTIDDDGVKNSIRYTADGTRYVKLDGNIFLKSDGTEMTPTEAYNTLIGKKITLEDGDVITFIKKLPGQKYLYKELFRKLPGYEDGIDVKAISETINKNIVEVVEASTIQDRNQKQIHPHIGVVDFDQREVYLADDSTAYRLELCIANLTDGTKIAYVKRYIEKASSDVTQKIKKAEATGQTRLNRLSNGSITQPSNKSQEKNSDRYRVTPEEDEAYMDAYLDGDDDLMQELVDKVAYRLGYKYKAFHHTENGFTVFDLSKARSSMDIQGFFFSADKDAESEYGSVRYDTYLKMDNPYIVDSKEKQQAIPFDMSKDNAGVIAREWLQSHGYDSVIRKAEYFGAEADEYIVFDPSQIKSSDPMTFEDDEYGEGDVIPLSKRFDSSIDDIRYSDRDTSGRALTEGQKRFFADSKARDTEGNLLVLYHGTPKQFTVFKQRKAQGWGTGIYFTDNREDAGEYGENIVEAYLNITNPYNADTMSYDNIGAETTKAYRDYDMQVWKNRFDEYDSYEEYKADGMGVDMYEIYTEEVEVFNKILRELGYDGIIADHSNNIEGLEIVAFHENQPKLTTNLNPTKDADVRYQDRDYSKVGSKAVMTADRIDDLIEDSGAGRRVDYANYWITSISPTDFINMTTTPKIQDRSAFDKFPSEWNDDATMETYDYMGELKKNRQTPYLSINIDTGEVVGHEGRHRMRALEREGIESVEIMVEFKDEDYRIVKYSPDGKRLQIKDAVKIINQFGTGQTASITNVIPLNEDYRSEIFENYGEDFANEDDIKYQDRDMEAAKHLSPRSLLADALESTIDTSTQEGQNELRKLKEYKERIRKLEKLSKDLSEVNGEIKSISFTKGKDRSKLVELNARKVALEDHINRIDKRLLQLEATKPLRDVLVRERKKGEKKLKEKYDALLKKQRKDRDDKLKAISDRYTESRKKNVDGRRKTEVKRKIKRVCADLNKMLNAGKDKANVKEGVRDIAEQALASAALLFETNVTNMDIVRNGVSSVSERESLLLNEYTDLMAKREEYLSKIEAVKAKNGNTNDLYKMIDSIDRRIGGLNKDLSELFERERKRISESTVDFAIKALADAYKATENSEVEYIKGAYNEFVYQRLLSLMNELNGTMIRDMTLDQLNAVYDDYKMVLHTIRKANSLFKQGKAVFVDQTAGEVIDQVKVLGDPIKLNPTKEKIKSFTWEELKPRNAFERIGSSTLLDLFDQLRTGEDTFAVDVYAAFQFASAQRAMTGYYGFDMLEKHSFNLVTGKTFNVNLAQMLSIYAYSKRPQARDHMLEGGFVFDSKEFFTKGKNGVKKLHEGFEQYSVSAVDVSNIIAEIPKPLIDYVDAMQKYLSETMGAKGNETSMEVFGIKLFKEDFYFPLVTSKDFIKQSNEPVQAMSLVNSGMTKPTTPHADNPIVLTSFDSVWSGHVNKMSLYHSFVPHLENIRRVYNYYSKEKGAGYNSVKATIKTVFGESATGYVDKFIDDVNGGMPSNEPGNPLMGLFSKFKKTAVGMSLSTVIQQPTAIIRAMADIDPKYFANLEELKHKSAWEELKQYAPIAILKEIGGFDTGSGRGVVDYLSGDATKNNLEIAFEKIDDASMYLAGKADEFGWNIIWGAVKKEIASTTNLKVGSEEFLKRCGERFTEVVHKTQVYDSVFTRSGFLRSKNDLVKLSMSFLAEPTTAINMLYSAVLNAKRGDISKGQMARSCGAVVASQILASFMASLIYGMRDDDEDEAYVEKVLEQFGAQLLDDTVLFIPKSLPFIKDIMTLFEGWDVERNDMSILTDIRDAFDGLFSDNKSTYRKIEDFAGAIAATFGLPVKNLMRECRALYNFVGSFFDGVNPTWGSAGSAYASGIVDNGIVGGAKETVKKIGKALGWSKSGSDSDDDSAVRKELRSKDKRIKEAASAVIGGNYAAIEDYTDTIVAEGKYSKDDVVGAINSEVTYFNNKIKKAAEAKIDGDNSGYKDVVRDLRTEYRKYFTQDEIVSMISQKVKDIQAGATDEDDTEKSTSYYKPYMVNDALDNGDTAQALKIIDDIVKAKMENGDTKKEAKASVKSSITSHWKPLFLEAYKSKDNAEMTRIRKLLRASKLYDDVIETTQGWIKSQKKK